MAPSAREAATKDGTGDGVIGWKLDRGQRKELLQPFPPRYGEVDGDHVTLRTGSAEDSPLPRETDREKVRWAAKYFPGTRIITTLARNKRNHAREGDVLVDDQLRHAHLWEEAGGIFIHHSSVEETLERLKGYFEL